MEVPRRPRPPSITLVHPKPASSSHHPQGVVRRNAMKSTVREKKRDGSSKKDDEVGEEKLSSEEETTEEPLYLELIETNSVPIISRLPSQNSFSEENSVSEEVLAEEARKKHEEEEAAAKERAAQRQQLSIEELVQSERNYLRMLQICSVDIRSSLQQLQPPLANLDSLFLYVEDVMDVSSRFLSLLDQKQLQSGEPRFLQTLCDSFLSLSSDIEVAYKEYLAYYNQISVVENGYKQKEALWNQIVKIIKASAPEVNAASLSFFLVMPVQRIARYPLLLQTIQKHTDTAHPAYALLEKTAHTSVALNCRINEYKRIREVADKYKKTETLTIMDKFNRLNTHSIAKKTARFSQYLKHETGIKPKVQGCCESRLNISSVTRQVSLTHKYE